MRFSFFSMTIAAATAAAAFCQIPQATAAPALTGPECAVIGTVGNIETRKHYYQPESWRVGWGLPEYRLYTDVTLHLTAAAGEGCAMEAFQGKAFQLRVDQDAEKLETGLCLRALTQYSGDEFAIGQWLYDIEIIDMSSCAAE